MIKREHDILKTLARRLKSTRASVYMEFGATLPIVIFVLFFAVDFMRCLYCEQQLEIASRALADIEAHINPRNDTVVVKEKIPHRRAKLVVRSYLADVLKKEGLGATDGRDLPSCVYCKAEVGVVKTVMSGILDPVIKFFDGDPGKEYITNPFVQLIGKLLGKVLDFFTFRTDRYFTRILPSDLYVKASVSVLTLPYVPNGCWTFFGRKHSGGEGYTGSMLLPQYTPRQSGKIADYNRELLDGKRDRYYCVMPVMDTCPMAQGTYIKMLKQKFKKWL